MRRRTFLRSAAAAVPALGLHDLLAAQQSTTQPATPPSGQDLHVVGSGLDRMGQHHTQGFSSMLFKVMPSETGGGLFLIEHEDLKPGGPALHRHLYQEEWFYVMEGKVAFQVGDQRLQLHSGDSVLAPRMIPHTFSAVGETPGRMLIAFTPAGKMEQFFRDSNGPVPAKDAPAWFRRYDMEYMGPSPFWKS